jgi:hypothetical protein
LLLLVTLTATTPPAIAKVAATAVDIEPLLQWLEPFLTNQLYSIPNDPTFAQYCANVTSDKDIDVWIQYYALVTFYYEA